MPKPVATVRTVVINTLDPSKLAPFWMALLDVEVAREIPGGYFIWLKPQQKGGVSVALQKVEKLTDHPNRLHFDTSVGDIAEAVTQIEKLGGSVVSEHEVMGFSWNVMADPEGNEFCIAAEPN